MDILMQRHLREFRFAAAANDLRNCRINCSDSGLDERAQSKVIALADLFGDCGPIPGIMGDFVEAILESIGVFASEVDDEDQAGETENEA